MLNKASYFLQISTGADTASAGPTEETVSFFSLITSGGTGGIIIMSMLFILAIIAVYLFFERFGAIKRANKVDPNFMNNLKDHVANGKMEAAQALCESTDTPVSRLLQKGVSRIGKSMGDISASIENQGKIEVQRLEKGLPYLATISGGAPMIGFLGTVIGMVLAFKEMANAGGQVDVSLLAEGIYTAMTTTVGGLFVGIMAYFGYNYLTTRVESVVYKMEVSATEFLDLLHEPL
ncbi:MAG: MotA/TolQ/ExbB proton channel family protein [Flavobacteriia bacterium]|nr:MotA/TolQ/ExbB proton channel family protein [Flavobacteriia bacterium]